MKYDCRIVIQGISLRLTVEAATAEAAVNKVFGMTLTEAMALAPVAQQVGHISAQSAEPIDFSERWVNG